MNGTYNITLHTPMGTQSGILTLTNHNGVLNGSIRTMGNTSAFKNGKVRGNSFEFSGILDVGFFKINYAAKGTVEGNTLKATATTNSGVFHINGTRVA